MTLKRLWLDNGEKPFWAKKEHGDFFYCLGISPREIAMGWDQDGEDYTYGANEDDDWTLCEDPKKPKPNMRLFCVVGHSQHYKTGSLHFLDANKVQLNLEIFQDVTEQLRALFEGE